MCVSSSVGHLPNLPFGCNFRISVRRGWGPVTPLNGFQWSCEGRIHILVLDHMRACVCYSPCRSQNVCRVPGPAAVLPQTPKPFSNRTTLNRVRQGPSSRCLCSAGARSPAREYGSTIHAPWARRQLLRHGVLAQNQSQG